MAKLTEVRLVWGTPSDIEMVSDGGGEFASAFQLTPRGAAKVAVAAGVAVFRYAESCACPEPKREGDGVHIAGEPSDLICLAEPLVEESGGSGS